MVCVGLPFVLSFFRFKTKSGKKLKITFGFSVSKPKLNNWKMKCLILLFRYCNIFMKLWNSGGNVEVAGALLSVAYMHMHKMAASFIVFRSKGTVA